MQSSPPVTLGWVAHEINLVSAAARAGRMKLDDAFDGLDAIGHAIVGDRGASALVENVEAGGGEADEPPSSPATSDASVDAYDFETEDDPNKSRPFGLFIVDLVSGDVMESPHKFCKHEAIDLLKNWRTRKEQAVLIFWPDYARCAPPFLRPFRKEVSTT